jgi:hypothetical protein
MSFKIIFAPSWANFLAISLPIPFPEPVTKTTFLSSFKSLDDLYINSLDYNNETNELSVTIQTV